MLLGFQKSTRLPLPKRAKQHPPRQAYSRAVTEQDDSGPPLGPHDEHTTGPPDTVRQTLEAGGAAVGIRGAGGTSAPGGTGDLVWRREAKGFGRSGRCEAHAER